MRTNGQIEADAQADCNSAQFLEWVDRDLGYSQADIDSLIQRSAPAGVGIVNPDAWLEELRGESRHVR